ncbi:glycosyltransferase family 92 protein [bacterium]|nr:glycosyltransferase family 92 protein [bacterium]
MPKNIFKKDNSARPCVNLSIVAIYKNEPDIIEWIEYHKLIGVQRFYLYDNESTDNSYELLAPYIQDGTVVYHFAQGKCQQMPVYRDAIFSYKNETNWLAIIDLDEYIVPVECENLSSFLEEYKDFPALGVNWVMFDSNGYEKRPNKLVIEAYTRVQSVLDNPVNRHIKSIVNPKKVRFVTNPHYCFYKNHELAVDENRNPIGSYPYIGDKNAFTKNISVNKIRINHYHTKSLEDYNRKRELGFADTLRVRPQNNSCLNYSNFREDFVIQKFLPKLKQKMFDK